MTWQPDLADATGSLAGSEVYSYVWPTDLSPAAVGFEADTGVLSLAVTAHPDFDDTPLFDENRDGRLNNDGNTWHSHWVVLAPHPQCPDGGLGVVDISEGENPQLPAQGVSLVRRPSYTCPRTRRTSLV